MQIINDVVSRRAAAVVAFVNYDALFVNLREVVAIEIREARTARVRRTARRGLCHRK